MKCKEVNKMKKIKLINYNASEMISFENVFSIIVEKRDKLLNMGFTLSEQKENDSYYVLTLENGKKYCYPCNDYFIKL